MIQQNKLITFIGTGGVGKTSLSLAVAIQAALAGKRVAAITVDPSRRLTNLLGIEESSGAAKTLEWKELSGSLDVYYIDSQKVFQKFVSENISSEFYKKLEKNGIYKQISKNLRETHNFAALYKVVEIISENKYDLIILDTPPCNQVIEFFESPRRLQKFFEGRGDNNQGGWFSWVQEKGVKIAESFLKTLVGSEFVTEMDNFFSIISKLKGKIQFVSSKFISQLNRSDSKLILVFPPAEDKISDALFLGEEMSRNKFGVDEFVMNRAYPVGLDFSKELNIDKDSLEKKIYNYYSKQKSRNLELLKHFKGRQKNAQVDYSIIPELDGSLDSLEDIMRFSNDVERTWEKN